jgi:hypothetical protein
MKLLRILSQSLSYLALAGSLFIAAIVLISTYREGHTTGDAFGVFTIGACICLFLACVTFAVKGNSTRSIVTIMIVAATGGIFLIT